MLDLFGRTTLSVEIQIVLSLTVTIAWPVILAILVQVNTKKLLSLSQLHSISIPVPFASTQVSSTVCQLQPVPEHVAVPV